ncbi:MAG: hypothetical protein IJW57_01920 [Spirochaetaceae bacterium]|nr:hypothetical protein [Spirochaetaceae bacterium]
MKERIRLRGDCGGTRLESGGLPVEQATLGTDFYGCLIMVLAGSDEDGIFRNLVHETMLMVYPA